jgi:hypothetical protein
MLGETWKELNERTVYILTAFQWPCAITTASGAGGSIKKKSFADTRPARDAITIASKSTSWGAQLSGDKAYNDYAVEDMLHDLGIQFWLLRKQNSKRPLPPWVTYLMASYWKRIETTGSLIERILPKYFHAVTAAGFELKVALFVLACSLSYLG